MDLETTKERHAILKRKATESVNELFGIEKSASAKRKNQLQKLRDLDAYKSIIKTYKAPAWYGCAVSPRDLADFGWAYLKSNTAKCVECDQIISTVLPNISSVSINVYNASLKHIHEKMVTAHRPTCRQKVGAPPFRLVEPSSAEVLDSMKQRLTGASSFNEEDINTEVPEDITLPEIEGYDQPLVFVAAAGWHISKPKRGYMALSCDLCARELIIKCGSKFDAVKNHERWCPQVDKDEQGESSWQTDLNIALNNKTKSILPNSTSALLKDVFLARRSLSNSISSIVP